jgi:uncharacterized protein (DUF488 family)
MWHGKERAVGNTAGQAAGELWSIGHSNASVERLIALLRQHSILQLADVRSAPYSRHWPQFNREALAASLKVAGIDYVFLGSELGGKPDDPALRGPHGLPDYDAIAATPLYQEGLRRLMALGAAVRTAFLCSEGDPMQCHREKLVARSLRAAGWRVHHILQDGSLQGEVQPSLW